MSKRPRYVSVRSPSKDGRRDHTGEGVTQAECIKLSGSAEGTRKWQIWETPLPWMGELLTPRLVPPLPAPSET